MTPQFRDTADMTVIASYCSKHAVPLVWHLLLSQVDSVYVRDDLNTLSLLVITVFKVNHLCLSESLGCVILHYAML